jgi:hypothetical protein
MESVALQLLSSASCLFEVSMPGAGCLIACSSTPCFKSPASVLVNYNQFQTLAYALAKHKKPSYD